MIRSRHIRAGLVALTWAASLLGVGLWAQDAPTPELPPTPIRPPVVMQSDGGTVLSGDDVGVRVVDRRDGIVQGVLVVRVNGQWVEVAASPRLTPTR